MQRLCNIQLHGWGFDDPDCPLYCGVHIRLNDQVVYERLRLVHEAHSGFHLGLINIRSCSLLFEPQPCDTYYRVEDNACVSDYVDAFPYDMEDVFIVVLSGNLKI